MSRQDRLGVVLCILWLGAVITTALIFFPELFQY